MKQTSKRHFAELHYVRPGQVHHLPNRRTLLQIVINLVVSARGRTDLQLGRQGGRLRTTTPVVRQLIYPTLLLGPKGDAPGPL